MKLSLAELLKALADENRLKIVALLSQGELCVCHVASMLELSQPNVSQHLSVLWKAGILERRRAGNWIYYGLRRDLEPGRQQLVQAILEAGMPEVPAWKVEELVCEG